MTISARYGPTDTLGDYRIDPPDEPEVDWELEELVEKAQKHHGQLESDGIELAEAGLLTADEDGEWETAFELFNRLLANAQERLVDVSRERREG